MCSVVPRMRFELIHPYGHCPLKTARLPIPPPGHGRVAVGTRSAVCWQEWRDSNPRPAVLETAALWIFESGGGGSP